MVSAACKMLRSCSWLPLLAVIRFVSLVLPAGVALLALALQSGPRDFFTARGPCTIAPDSASIVLNPIGMLGAWLPWIPRESMGTRCLRFCGLLWAKMGKHDSWIAMNLKGACFTGGMLRPVGGVIHRT
jgi:hypothetical protein